MVLLGFEPMAFRVLDKHSTLCYLPVLQYHFACSLHSRHLAIISSWGSGECGQLSLGLYAKTTDCLPRLEGLSGAGLPSAVVSISEKHMECANSTKLVWDCRLYGL